MELTIKNFRSIENQKIDLTPITVVYGPNGAGKSSLLYALLTLKTIILNPNQNPNGFFNYSFTNLGSFEAVVFDHKKNNMIELGISYDIENKNMDYRVIFNKDDGYFIMSYDPVQFSLAVSFPYRLNEEKSFELPRDEYGFSEVRWNGITANINSDETDSIITDRYIPLLSILNSLPELFRKVNIVPLGRGFNKPHYSTVPVSPTLISEDEVATLLSENKYLVQRVSHYLEKILERDFRVHFKAGTAIFTLDTTDKNTGIGQELVNDGFGVSQVVYFLAKCLDNDTEILCVEEPEIHLHPTAIRKLANAIVTINKKEKKRFVISTHSETFVASLLSLVAKGELPPNELGCYFARKDGKKSNFERQLVNDDGQIEGGLYSFIEGEFEEIQSFLKSSKL